MSQAEAPFVYSEEHNGVHPKAELHLEADDIATINRVMDEIAERRAEHAEERPKELFAGMTTGEERGGLLVAVDIHHPGTAERQFVVRSARIGQGSDPLITEELVDRENVTDYRNPVQDVWTHTLGGLKIGTAGPDERFDRSTYEPTPFVARDGKRLVSFADAFSPYTEDERIQLALDAMNPANHRGLYPNVDNTYLQDDTFRSRLDAVRGAIYPMAAVLRREQKAGDRWNQGVERTMTAEGRAHLVGMAHEIMALANETPENVDRGNVINRVEAEYRAHAENEVRKTQKSDGLLGHRRKQNAQARSNASTKAGAEYAEAVRQSVSSPQPEA